MKKTSPEYETIICINAADKAEGFFRIGTSIPGHFRRICRKVGRENLIDLRISLSADGNPCYWDCKIPIGNLQESSLSVKKLVKPSRNLTQKERDIRGARLLKFRYQKSHKMQGA